MQIIIPMSGIGKRFIDMGYVKPKPLIPVDGKPMIEHVVNLFPGEKDITFICNQDHIDSTDMESIISDISPSGKIMGIEPHKKGPVYAVSKIFDIVNDNDEVIVNYCDFAKYWNYQDFLAHTRNRDADGAISAYKGFHPHMLGTTNYAFMRDNKQWMLEIQEKKPFTNNRMDEYASDGTYYFKKGSYVKEYFNELMDKDINLNGEYYVSMIYNLLVRDNLKVSIFEIQHMLQWGMPRDLEEYQKWSDYFRSIIKPASNIKPQKNSITLIPLAGRGTRFLDAGYRDPKPLIEVSGKPMIIQAASCLPRSENNYFVCLKEHLDVYQLDKYLKEHYPDSKIIPLNQVTAGQACTCEIGLSDVDLDSPLLISASDNGAAWNKEKYEALINDDSIDAVFWSFRRHPSSERNPQMYGWIDTDDNDNIIRVSVKKALSENPYDDHAIVGTFYFKKARHFLDALERMYEKNIRINNEFYVDSTANELIEMGLNLKVFEVDHYICWGTPDDLKTYEYWQSFFHKCHWHPYSIREDIYFNKVKNSIYEKRYSGFHQECN